MTTNPVIGNYVRHARLLWALGLILFAASPAQSLKLPDGVGILGGSMVLENYPRSEQFPLREVSPEDPKYKLLVIIPIVTKQFNEALKKEISVVQASDFQIDYMNLSSGTNFIESRYAEFLDTASIVEIAKQAQEDGYDAIFITCFGEPGVSVVRELVEIPVIGGFLSSAMTSNVLSHKFSIVTVVPDVIPMLRELARTLGVEENLTSIREIDVPVPELGNITLVEEKLLDQSLAAIQIEGAQAIVMGCTGMLGVREYVEAQIQEQLQLANPVPVISPNQHSVAYLQSMVRMGLTHSRLAFFKSNAKPASGQPESGSN